MQSSHLIKSLIRIKGTILPEQYITRIFFGKDSKMSFDASSDKLHCQKFMKTTSFFK